MHSWRKGSIRRGSAVPRPSRLKAQGASLVFPEALSFSIPPPPLSDSVFLSPFYLSLSPSSLSITRLQLFPSLPRLSFYLPSPFHSRLGPGHVVVTTPCHFRFSFLLPRHQRKETSTRSRLPPHVPSSVASNFGSGLVVHSGSGLCVSLQAR